MFCLKASFRFSIQIGLKLKFGFDLKMRTTRQFQVKNLKFSLFGCVREMEMLFLLRVRISDKKHNGNNTHKHVPHLPDRIKKKGEGDYRFTLEITREISHNLSNNRSRKFSSPD